MPLRISGLVLGLSAMFALTPAALEGADANGDTRTLSIVNVHTNEGGTVTFKRNGVYDAEALKQLSWLLRDWRRDEQASMSPRLFDILWEVHQEAGSQEPFHAVSGYRSPETNAMLRRSSHLVAEHSQHMLGRAMDSFLPDVPIERMREIAMRLQRGGVGYYPTSGSPFVHIDAGSVRSWPRMTRDQLARLFPDGKTVHIPADGHPFPGYEQAKAEILAAGGSVAGYAAYAEAEPVSGGQHKSLWAALFGGGADEEEDAAIAGGARSGPSRAAAARQASQLALLTPSNSDDAGVHAFIMSQARTLPTAQASAESAAPRSRNTQAGRFAEQTEQPKTAQVTTASTAPTAGISSFLSALRGETTASATGSPTETGTAAPDQSNGQAQTGTTIAQRSDTTDDDNAAAQITAFAPLPPHRPKSLTEIASLVDIPVPPARPADFDSPDQSVASGAPPGTAESNARAPSDAGELVALDHPLPPPRPSQFALAAPAVSVTASDEASAGSGTNLGVAHHGPNTDGMMALFDSSALVPSSRLGAAPIKVTNAVAHTALPKMAQDVIIRSSSTAGHFMTSTARPIANRFSGKAVEPLKALGFAATE
jgi:uncharacterized protein YcbK (DUF882 family)